MISRAWAPWRREFTPQVAARVTELRGQDLPAGTAIEEQGLRFVFEYVYGGRKPTWHKDVVVYERELRWHL